MKGTSRKRSPEIKQRIGRAHSKGHPPFLIYELSVITVRMPTGRKTDVNVQDKDREDTPGLAFRYIQGTAIVLLYKPL